MKTGVEPLLHKLYAALYGKGHSVNTAVIPSFSTVETHFGSLLDSEAANQIIERKLDAALARPEGMQFMV